MYLALENNIFVCAAAARKLLRYRHVLTCYSALQAWLLNLFSPWIDALCVW